MRTVFALILVSLLAACGEPAPIGPGNEPTGRLAFRTGNSVRVIEIDGAEVATLPCHMGPSFSPDGSKIACLGAPEPQFVQQFQDYMKRLQEQFGSDLDPQRLRGFAFHGSINIADSDGSNLRTVSDQVAYFRVWWSRTGDRLFFQSGFGVDESRLEAGEVGSVGPLFAVGANDDVINQLSEPVPLSLSPSLSWSEDLQWKVAPAVQSTAGQIVQATPQSLSLAQRIFLFPASGDQARQLTSQPAGHAHARPSISPDGRQITYNAARPSTAQSDSVTTTLHVVDFSGEFERQIGTDCSVAEWSKDGRRLLLGCADSRVAVLDLQSGVRTDIGTGRFPVFSPDDRWVAFAQALDSGGSRIDIARSDGSETRQILELPGSAEQLEW